MDREVGQTGQPDMPLGDVQRERKRIVLEQLGKARARAGAQVAVEGHLRHVTGARLQELSQRAAIADGFLVAPAPEPASQRIDEATKGGRLHRRIIRRKRRGQAVLTWARIGRPAKAWPGQPGEGTIKEEGMQ
jgi:hypothetical protein